MSSVAWIVPISGWSGSVLSRDPTKWIVLIPSRVESGPRYARASPITAGSARNPADARRAHARIREGNDAFDMPLVTANSGARSKKIHSHSIVAGGLEL